MSFRIDDEDKRTRTTYFLYVEGVSLKFDLSWTGSEVQIFRTEYLSVWNKVMKGCGTWVAPRSLEWVPSTRCHISFRSSITAEYRAGELGRTRTSVIARWEDLEDLAQGAEYQHGSARLEIKRDFRFGASTVRMIVRKVSEYCGVPVLKLSVVIEDIGHDEWNKLRQRQQELTKRRDYIVLDVPYPFRGVIEQTPESPRQNNPNEVRHIAYESLPFILEHLNAQSEAIQRGLSYDGFLSEFPNQHETRVVRPPSAHTGTPLRAVRLDLYLASFIIVPSDHFRFRIFDIDLQITAITRSPYNPNNLSSCAFRLDAHYAALANATIPDYSSQIIKVSTDSQSTERVIPTNDLTQTITVNVVQVMGSVTGDIYGAPIHGGNVGGRSNTNNNIPTLTPDIPSRRKGGILLRLFDLLLGM
ncbi:hypothetical protein AB1N83_013354 [Pleurotus pulmonarius]